MTVSAKPNCFSLFTFHPSSPFSFFPAAERLRGSSHLVSELVINERLVVTLFNEGRLTAGGLFRALVAVACSRYLLTYLLEVCSLKLQTNV